MMALGLVYKTSNGNEHGVSGYNGQNTAKFWGSGFIVWCFHACNSQTRGMVWCVANVKSL